MEDLSKSLTVILAVCLAVMAIVGTIWVVNLVINDINLLTP